MADTLALIWQAPLAVGSRILFVITRWILRRVANLKLRRQGQSTCWQLLGQDLLDRRFALPVIMTEGPRWNTHATIARIGPLDVRESLEIRIEQAATSTRAWTIVLYKFPRHATEQVIGPQDLDHATSGWIERSLSPGSYSLIVRYYGPEPDAILPAIRVDNEPTVETTAVPAETNDFYHGLSQRRRFFYLWLHYHAYVMLRRRNRLPASLVRRVYLPVGNPETTFRYGALEAEQTLIVDQSERLQRTHDVYITFYDLASFPLRWQRLTESHHQWEPLHQRCTYLMRLHRRTADEDEPNDTDLKIQTIEQTH